MLTFDYNGEKVVVSADTKWKDLPSIERKFLSKCYWIGLLGSEIVDEQLVIDRISWGQLRSLQDVVRFDSCGECAKFTKAFMDYAVDRKDEYDAIEKRKQEEREYQQRVADLKKQVEYAQQRMKEGCGWCSEKYYDREQRCQMCKYACKAVRYRGEDIEWQFECWKEAKALKIEQEYFAPAYPVVGCKYLVEGQRALETLREMGEA